MLTDRQNPWHERPTVFLSYSHQDQSLIKKIAEDLTRFGIQPFYDQWEIHPGEPLTKRIIREAIPNCDLFFVYLTKSSITSYWVQKELEVSLSVEFSRRGGELAPFVSSDDIRKTLPIDLQDLNSPVLDNQVYSESITQLVSRAWHAYNRRVVAQLTGQHAAEMTQAKAGPIIKLAWADMRHELTPRLSESTKPDRWLAMCTSPEAFIPWLHEIEEAMLRGIDIDIIHLDAEYMLSDEGLGNAYIDALGFVGTAAVVKGIEKYSDTLLEISNKAEKGGATGKLHLWPSIIPHPAIAFIVDSVESTERCWALLGHYIYFKQDLAVDPANPRAGSRLDWGMCIEGGDPLFSRYREFLNNYVIRLQRNNA